MSRALHIATTYKVEWSSMTAFNHKSYEFRALLTELGANVSCLRSTDDGDYEDFEVTKGEWADAIYKLERIDKLPQPERVTIKDQLKRLGYSAAEMAGMLRRYLELAEVNDGWLHFSFF